MEALLSFRHANLILISPPPSPPPSFPCLGNNHRRFPSSTSTSLCSSLRRPSTAFQLHKPAGNGNSKCWIQTSSHRQSTKKLHSPQYGYAVVRCDFKSMSVSAPITPPPPPDHASLGFAWSSRLRGISFHAVTCFLAVLLFLVMLAIHPIVMLFDKYRRNAHHFVAMIWSTLTLFVFCKIEYEGLENLPPDDLPAVYVSNHQSYLDIYTLLTLGRSFKFISKTGIFMIPVVGWAMSLMGIIPLRRMDTRSQLDCLRRCIDLVKKGTSVLFFPEGTRSKDRKMAPFKKGAFSVAVKAGSVVVPITLLGTGKIMPRGKEGIINDGSIKVLIHKAIEGRNADELCTRAHDIIAQGLLLHGHDV